MTTDSGETGATSSVTFSTHFVVHHKDHAVGILGSIYELGNWGSKSTVVLTSQENNVWERILTLPTSRKFEWKLVLFDISSYSVLRWEESSNRTLHVFGPHPFILKCYWGCPELSEIKHILVKEYTDTTGLDTKNETINKKGIINTKKQRGKARDNTETESVNRNIYFGEDSSDMEYLISEEDTKDADTYIDKLASKYSREKKLVKHLKHLTGTDKKAQAPLQNDGDAKKSVRLQKINYKASKQRTHLSLSSSDNTCSSGENCCDNAILNTTNRGGTTDRSLRKRELESAINTLCASKRCTNEHCNTIDIAGIPIEDGDETRHQSKTRCFMCEGPSILEKQLNVLELTNIFEDLSKQVNENKEKHWLEDHDLLLQRKRVQILKRLMMMKISSENHSEEYRQSRMKSISALTYNAQQLEKTDGDTVNLFDLLEVDQHILESLYSELRLKDNKTCSPRSADSINDTDTSESSSCSATASGVSTNSDDPVLSYGNDECSSVQKTLTIQKTGFFSMCRENKTAVFTSAALGLSLTVGLAFLKLRK